MASHPDARLIDLGRQFDRAAAEFDLRYAKHNKLWEESRTKEPEPSSSLFCSRTDLALFGNLPRRLAGTRYDANHIVFFSTVRGRDWTADRRKRASEILRAWALWQSAMDAHYLSYFAPHTDPDDAFDEIYEPVLKLEQLIRAEPAHTIAGLHVKARAFTWTCTPGVRDLDDLSTGATESLLSDIFRIAARETPPDAPAKRARAAIA
jgi:hypothetical protein